MDYSVDQALICQKYNASYFETPLFLKVGISMNVKGGILPINGLRIAPSGDTTGWYIWAGESFSDDPDFFLPVHVEHLLGWCPAVIKYLGLPPGWRFIIAPQYEDVWSDPDLLKAEI